MPPPTDDATFRSIATMTHTAHATAENTTEEVLAANTGRVYALIQNDGSAVIYINLGGDAVQHEGVRLAASGGSYEITLDNLYRGEIDAICANSGKVLLITEGVM